MDNPEEVLHSLEEFSKLKPKDIPRELEEYLCFVAKTGDPLYQWAFVKSLLREKLISVITEFYESSPTLDIPPCPNVEIFNYESMKSFILEKLDTFAAAPFTVQRICELLTTPRKEYNRIDKYMRALEKNILVVSTVEPGSTRRTSENGDGLVNGLESEHEHTSETNSSNHDINVEEMDDPWPVITLKTETVIYQNNEASIIDPQSSQTVGRIQETFISESRVTEAACTSSADSIITCRTTDQEEQLYVSIEPVAPDSCNRQEAPESDVSVTITAIPAAVQRRRDSIEPVVSSDDGNEEVTESVKCTSDETTESEPAISSSENSPQEPQESVQNVSELIDSSSAEVDPATTENEITPESLSSENSLDEAIPNSSVEQTVTSIEKETLLDEPIQIVKSPEISTTEQENVEEASKDSISSSEPLSEEPSTTDVEMDEVAALPEQSEIPSSDLSVNETAMLEPTTSHEETASDVTVVSKEELTSTQDEIAMEVDVTEEIQQDTAKNIVYI